MKFNEVVNDIKKLVGTTLKSIRAGADITVTEVNQREERIELIDASGNRRSRSLQELRRVWDQLCADKAVHVDSVLGGSGSSRNQPETILANLPYVEWLKIDGRKHITFVGRNSHPLATLKEMDPLSAHALRESLTIARSTVPAAILVVENLKSISSFLESVSGLAPAAVASGVYRQVMPDREYWIAAPSSCTPPLAAGAYVTLASKTRPPGSTQVAVAGTTFYLVGREGGNFLICDV